VEVFIGSKLEKNVGIRVRIDLYDGFALLSKMSLLFTIKKFVCNELQLLA